MSFSGNMRRNNNKMPARGGPLMTDHLHDLELELELLKRKRQLIQQQQSSMLFNRGPADNMNYNQPSQSYNNRFNEPQPLSFSHLYNETPRDDRSFGLKRRAEPEWSNAPNDRFNGPMGGNKRPRQSGPVNRFTNQSNTQNFQRPRPNKPQPLLSQPQPPPLMSFQPQPARRAPQPLMPKPNQGPKPLTHHPNFKRNRQPGPGPRPGFTPNKFNTFKKASPVKFNSKPQIEKSTMRKEKKAPVLSVDEEPSPKMNGRIELALGTIVKEMRVIYGNKPEYKTLFTSMNLARIMKQRIRERLHGVMTGKVIGLVPDMVAEYRLKYPLSTDKEVVNLALVEKQKNDQKSESAIKLLEEGDPEQFFKKNMGRLIESTFGAMIQKFQKVINDDTLTTDEILEQLPELNKIPESEQKTEGEATDTEATDANATEITTSEANATETTTNEANATETTTTEANATETTTTEANATETTTTEDPTTESPVKTEEGLETSIDTSKTETPMDVDSKEEYYKKWLSLYFQRKLPGLLLRNKNAILRLFELNQVFRNTRAAIIINTNKKAQAINKKGLVNGSEQASDPELPRNLPYFAKVLAHPAIPKRKLMQEFLDQFNPKTIKRHKKNFNLLFIGFNSKEDYDKILAANRTVVGNATLTIAGNVIKTTTVEINDDNDIDQVLTPQLDDQINDLLSSIRKADEESKATGDTSNTSAEVDLTDDPNENKVEHGDEKPETNENKEEAANDSEKSADAKNVEAKDTEKSEDGNTDDECQVVEPNGKEVVTIEDDVVAPLKSDEVKAAKPPGTPAKGRAPATATPSSIRTRRSSRLVQN